MIGQQIQNYTVTSYLGEGGMGTVFRASDNMLGRDVALKMLHGNLIMQPQFLERFKKEARVLAQLLHPNIAVIYNFIGHDNNHFMVMEFVEGDNLDSLLRKHKIFPANLVVAMFLQVLEGLHHAHKKGIFHRDIKPANLILTPDGTVKLMDFGIAKMAGEQRMTQVNRVVGTIEYMAPELIEGKDPSIASDIYATGVTMYELLTGKLPFEGGTDFTLMQDILKKKPVSIDRINPGVPAALNAIVMKCLEKKPEHRYVDAKAFQQALIKAFPQIRDIDVSQLTKQTPATQQAQVVALTTKISPATAVNTGTHRRISLPKVNLDAIRQKVLTREKAPLLIGGASILLALVLLLPQILKPSPDQNHDQVAEQTIEKPKDSLSDKSESNSPVYYSDLRDTANRTNRFAIPVNDNTSGQDQPKETEKKKEERKKDVQENKQGNQQQNKKETEPEKKEEPVPVIPETDKKPEPVPVEPDPKPLKAVKLNSRLEVNLLLQETLTEATAQEGKVLHFTVTNPVMYNGETIITKGASATGRIKNVGKKKMSIILNSVNSAGGQALPFENIELSGRIEDILSARHYSGTLKKGTTINF